MSVSSIGRIDGRGWLALIGGGEFSFEETEAADAAWLAKSPARASAGDLSGDSTEDLSDEGFDGSDGVVGFVPTASGSTDYGNHFAVYLDEYFERQVETIPVYRARDARRGKNAERIAAADHVYLGGGVADHLIDALDGSPCLDALRAKLEQGGTVAAIAAAAQSLGQVTRSLFGGKLVPGLGWLPGGVVETNFEPKASRRLRRLLAHPDARWGVGIAAGAALLLGPGGELETVGEVWRLDDPEGEPEPLRMST